jgi:hypothetical protein
VKAIALVRNAALAWDARPNAWAAGVNAVQQHYTWMRPVFERAWDPVWATVTRAERLRLLKKACLAVASDDVRAETEQFSDENWGVALDTFEADIVIIMQTLPESSDTWVDVEMFQGHAAVSEAMASGIVDPRSVEALRLYRPGGSRAWIATKPRRGRWVLHTKRYQ